MYCFLNTCQLMITNLLICKFIFLRIRRYKIIIFFFNQFQFFIFIIWRWFWLSVSIGGRYFLILFQITSIIIIIIIIPKLTLLILIFYFFIQWLSWFIITLLLKAQILKTILFNIWRCSTNRIWLAIKFWRDTLKQSVYRLFIKWWQIWW